MKKNIGSVLALYPTPATVIGAMNEEKPAWTLVAHVGSVSGAKVDKSAAFAWEVGEAGAPVITKAPLTMECSVEDIYETKGFESFICTIDNTYVEEQYLNDVGKIDYHTLKPVLFEMPTYEYLRTDEVIGKCLSFKKG